MVWPAPGAPHRYRWNDPEDVSDCSAVNRLSPIVPDRLPEEGSNPSRHLHVGRDVCMWYVCKACLWLEDTSFPWNECTPTLSVVSACGMHGMRGRRPSRRSFGLTGAKLGITWPIVHCRTGPSILSKRPAAESLVKAGALDPERSMIDDIGAWGRWRVHPRVTCRRQYRSHGRRRRAVAPKARVGWAGQKRRRQSIPRSGPPAREAELSNHVGSHE